MAVAVATVRAEIVTIFAAGDPAAPESYYPRATSSAYTNTYRHQAFSYAHLAWTNVFFLTNWTITIRAGEACKLIGCIGAEVVYQLGSDTNRPWRTLATTYEVFALVGPVSVACSAFNSDRSCATFSITRAEDFAYPSNLLAVEPDAAGPVAIRMESSTNLADWLPAYPGTYGVASQMRFFRLRATRSTLDTPPGP